MTTKFAAARFAVRIVLAALVACGLSLAITSPLAAAKRDDKLHIYWVDVEGGAATLIVTPAGESLLIDAGNPGRRDPDRIVKMAATAGVRRVDHLVTTHYHRDHFGGAATLAKLLPIGTVYDNGKFADMPNDPGKEYFELPCRRRVVVQPGNKIQLKQSGKSELKFTFLGGRRKFTVGSTANQNDTCAAHRPKDRDGSDNANSVVMLLEFGGFRFFDGGDLTWNQEQRLVCPKNVVGKVDVYQVTHHGLDSSNNPVIVRSLEPTVAVMNNGVTKGCMPEVFSTLTSCPSIKALYQMHKNMRPDGKRSNAPDAYIANLKRNCDGNYIHLAVNPNGTNYVVEVPARKHRAEYATRAGK